MSEWIRRRFPLPCEPMNRTLTSSGDAELLGSAPDHYTMEVIEGFVMNFDLVVVPPAT
jgi:hypothetical protein